jgi:hypothetical protein
MYVYMHACIYLLVVLQLTDIYSMLSNSKSAHDAFICVKEATFLQLNAVILHFCAPALTKTC